MVTMVITAWWTSPWWSCMVGYHRRHNHRQPPSTLPSTTVIITANISAKNTVNYRYIIDIKSSHHHRRIIDVSSTHHRQIIDAVIDVPSMHHRLYHRYSHRRVVIPMVIIHGVKIHHYLLTVLTYLRYVTWWC